MNKRSNSHPPQRFLQIVGWFCPDDLVEEIEGDLIQKYSGDLEKYGERRARRRCDPAYRVPDHEFSNHPDSQNEPCEYIKVRIV